MRQSENFPSMDSKGAQSVKNQIHVGAAINAGRFTYLLGAAEGGAVSRVLSVAQGLPAAAAQLVLGPAHAAGQAFVAVIDNVDPGEDGRDFVAELTSGARTGFAAKATHYSNIPPASFFKLYASAGPLLAKALSGTLPEAHPLRQAVRNFDYIRQTSTEQPGGTVGHFDQVFDGCAEGWVYSADNHALRLPVEIIGGGRVVAKGLAETYRPDLAGEGIGDGHYRFQLRLVDSLFDGQPHLLLARVERSDFILESNWRQFQGARRPVEWFDAIPYAEAVAMCPAMVPQQVAAPQGNGVLTPESCLMEASLALETGACDLAGRVFVSLTKLFGKHPLFYCKAAEAALLSSDVPGALALYEAGLAADRNFSHAQLGLANCYARQGNWERAIPAYQRAADAGLAPAQARLDAACGMRDAEQGRRLLEAGDIDGAAQCLRTAMQNNGDDRGIAALLQTALQLQGLAPAVPPALQDAALDKLMLDCMLDQAETHFGKFAV